MLPNSWTSLAGLIAVLAPLIGVPLALITFYLRSLRETQQSWAAEFRRRLAALESALRDLHRADADFARDFTTKEEWLREVLHARRLFERLTERTCRLEARLDFRTSPALEPLFASPPDRDSSAPTPRPPSGPTPENHE